MTEVNSDKPVGQVVYQSIAPNTEVEEGTGIVLQVSKGPEKQEPVTSTKNIEITLPDDERERGVFMFPSPAPASWKSASILTEVWKNGTVRILTNESDKGRRNHP